MVFIWELELTSDLIESKLNQHILEMDPPPISCTMVPEDGLKIVPPSSNASAGRKGAVLKSY